MKKFLCNLFFLNQIYLFPSNFDIYTHPKNVITHRNFFFFWAYLCHSLGLGGKSYISKVNILNFFMMQKFFLYFEDILSYNFLNKNRVFFYHIKNIISSSCFKKIFFLWKVLASLIILQKGFWKNIFIDIMLSIWHHF